MKHVYDITLTTELKWHFLHFVLPLLANSRVDNRSTENFSIQQNIPSLEVCYKRTHGNNQYQGYEFPHPLSLKCLILPELSDYRRTPVIKRPTWLMVPT